MTAAVQNLLLRLGTAFVPMLSRRGELRLSRFFAWCLCHPVFRFHRYAAANVDLVYGASMTPAEKAALVRDSFRSAALVLMDYFWFARHTTERLAKHVEVGDETMERWIAGRFPGVFITAHIGNWELAGLAIAERGRRLWSVFKELGSPSVSRRMREFRGSGGQRVIPRSGALAGILRALRARDVVALLLDQHVDLSDGGEYRDFLGTPATFSSAVGPIAAKLRVPVLVAAMIRDPARDVYVMRAVREFKAEETAAMAPDALNAAIVGALEEMVRRWPGQWFWMYRRWKRYRPVDDPSRFPWYAKPEGRAR